MIVCQSCGRQNGDDAQFCASCHVYLEWDGQRVATAPERPAAPPAPPPQRPGFVEQVRTAVGLPPRHPDPSAPGTADPTTPAAAAPRPAAAPEPVAVQPAPERGAPPPPAPVPVAQGPRPNAVYCSRCGVDNDDDRTLCRSCGTALRQFAPRRPPWWRRLFGRRTTEAGDRPGRRRRARTRRTRRLLRGTVVLGLVGTLAMLAGPWRGFVTDRYRDVKARFSTVYDPVTATTATATSSASGHGPELAIDGVKDTAWAEGVPGLGANQKLAVTLTGTVELARIGITPGASSKQQEFLAQARPREIRLGFPDGSTQTITLRDEADFQTFQVDTGPVNTVTLEILSVFSGQSGEDTSLAEVEFFTKR